MRIRVEIQNGEHLTDVYYNTYIFGCIHDSNEIPTLFDVR